MEFKQRSSGLPFKEMGSSPAKQATQLPTHGPVGGVTADDIETDKEDAERGLGEQSLVNILKNRKLKEKEKEENRKLKEKEKEENK